MDSFYSKPTVRIIIIIIISINDLLFQLNFRHFYNHGDREDVLAPKTIIRTNDTLPYYAQRASQKIQKGSGKKLVKSNKSKKFLREIAFLAVLNFFRVQKFMFGHF